MDKITIRNVKDIAWRRFKKWCERNDTTRSEAIRKFIEEKGK